MFLVILFSVAIFVLYCYSSYVFFISILVVILIVSVVCFSYSSYCVLVILLLVVLLRFSSHYYSSYYCVRSILLSVIAFVLVIIIRILVCLANTSIVQFFLLLL